MGLRGVMSGRAAPRRRGGPGAVMNVTSGCGGRAVNYSPVRLVASPLIHVKALDGGKAHWPIMSTPHAPIERPVVTEELLRRLDVNGPRYTSSYPTADRFVDAFGPDDYRARCERRGRRRDRRHEPAVGLRAHPVLRVAVLLLRVQQGDHQAPRARGRVPDALGQGDRTCTSVHWAPASRSRSCTSAAARRPSSAMPS